jgi:phosphoglycerate dehydrogenase-like enzyme
MSGGANGGPDGGSGGGSGEGAGPRGTGGTGAPAFVLDMRDRRPVWALPDWAIQEIRAALPGDWEFRLVDGFADGTGDGSGGLKPETLAALPGAVVYCGFGIPAEILRAGTSLRWVHSGSAGVGSSITPEMKASPVLFTNSAGIHGPPMAESVVGHILYFARGLDLAARAQREGRWNTEPFYAGDTPVREVAGGTVGIVGYGGIGREVAARVLPMGARVLGLKRRPGGEAPDGVELVHGDEGLDRLLAESDWLVVTAPDTPETRGLLTRERIGRMKPGAVFINVARGAIADEEALVDALRSGRLRGAALDVFAEEPLAPGHPFWTLPGVLVSPHVSPVSRGFWRRQVDLILFNLRAFQEGSPLRNQVDREAGY